MSSYLRRAVTAGLITVLAGTALAVVGGTAAAATTPPWEPDANAVGGLLFFDTQGHQITGGSINDTPIAAYVEGTHAIRAGDTNATLSGYLPVNGQAPSLWNGDTLSGNTAYPNSSAPAPLGSSSLPVVSGVATDFSIADLAQDYPTTTNAGYQNVYQLRLTSSAANTGLNTTYDAADILIDTAAGTWSVEYTRLPLTSTATSLAVSPSKVTHGAKVTLTATVSPPAAGTVTFLDGSKKLGTVPVSAGTAKYSTTALAGGKHKLKAAFAPTATQTYSGSTSSVHTLTVSAQATSTALKASKGTIKRGAKLTLKATEKPATAGSVTFYDGSKKLGAAKVKAGAAGLSTTKLSVGSHKLTARFTPSKKASYRTSTSKRVTVKVTK